MSDRRPTPNNIIYGNEAMTILAQGSEILERAVTTTLGPNGLNAVIRRGTNQAYITKDGVTVASSIKTNDPFLDIGIEMVRQAAHQTDREVGDGTSTTIYLANAMIKALIELQSTLSPLAARNKLDHEVNILIADINSAATPADSLDEVALTSSNGNAIISDDCVSAMYLAGPKPTCRMVRGYPGNLTEINVSSGLTIKRGHVQENLITDEIKKTIVHTGEIKVVDSRVFRGALNPTEPALIMHQNLPNGNLDECGPNTKWFHLQLPGTGIHQEEWINDMKTVMVANDVSGLYTFNGTVVLGSDSTSFITESKQVESRIAHRVNHLNKELAGRTLSPFEKNKLEDRISDISGGSITITVGGSTQLEINELYGVYEDTIHSCITAKQTGVVNGGCKTLLDSVNPDGIMFPIINALADIVKPGVLRTGFSPVDPAGTIIAALRNALSVASVISTAAVISLDPALYTEGNK